MLNFHGIGRHARRDDLIIRAYLGSRVFYSSGSGDVFITAMLQNKKYSTKRRKIIMSHIIH